jgi:hypothetical protein
MNIHRQLRVAVAGRATAVAGFVNTHRRLRVALAGYSIVAVFILSYLATNQAQNWFKLSAFTQPVILTIAILIAAPLALSFVWERLSTLKAFNFEIDLTDVTAKLDLKLLDELKDPSRWQFNPDGIEISDLVKPGSQVREEIKTAIRKAGSVELVDVKLGIGQSWWSTRLYLQAALAEDYMGLQEIVFLEDCDGQDNCLIGIASPAATRRALAAQWPILETNYREASEQSSASQSEQILTPEDAVVDIIHYYILQFFQQEGGEEKVKVWVTKPLLKQWLNEALIVSSVECKGAECDSRKPTPLLLYRILNCSAPFVALVRNRHLMQMVNRHELAVTIADTALRQQLQ